MSPEPKTTTPTPDAEPTVSMTTLPIWLVVVLLLLLFAAGLRFDSQGGWFSASVYGPYGSLQNLEAWQPALGGPDPLVLGRQVYNKPTCVACHQANGQGLPGQFPPLVKSDMLLEPEPGRVIRIVLNGLQGPMIVNGQSFNNAMVPWKDVLSDEEIAAVLTYVRQNKDWGNSAPAVTAEQVKAIREKTKDRFSSYTADELMKISPAE